MATDDDDHLHLLLADGDWHLRDDGRSMLGRIVPFEEPAIVVEQGERFEEEFLPGCMTRMCQIAARRGNAGWISLNLDHDETMDARIGYATGLEQRDDGGWAEFRLYPGNQLEKVRSMLTESHRGLSVMFDDIAEPRVTAGRRSRVQISVRHVAATPVPIYSGARVALVRDGTGSDAPTVDELGDRPALREWQTYLDGITRTP